MITYYMPVSTCALLVLCQSSQTPYEKANLVRVMLSLCKVSLTQHKVLHSIHIHTVMKILTQLSHPTNEAKHKSLCTFTALHYFLHKTYFHFLQISLLSHLALLLRKLLLLVKFIKYKNHKSI